MKSDLHEDIPENDNTDIDEELDAVAQGETVSLEGDEVGEDEINSIGEAAGIKDNPEKAFRGVEKIEQRDAHRWELDPKSKDAEA